MRTANITDRDGAITMIENAKQNLSEIKNTLPDGGYSGDKFAAKIKEIIGAAVEVVKHNELHKFVVLPKRWSGAFICMVKNVGVYGKIVKEKLIQLCRWL